MRVFAYLTNPDFSTSVEQSDGTVRVAVSAAYFKIDDNDRVEGVDNDNGGLAARVFYTQTVLQEDDTQDEIRIRLEGMMGEEFPDTEVFWFRDF